MRRSLEYCGAEVTIASTPEKILSSSRLILPGVGAFSNAMMALAERDLVEPITKVASSGKPLLGICLGMQLLLSESEEFGLTDGLGLIPGRVVSVPDHDTNGRCLKIPHIGWKELTLLALKCRLLCSITPEQMTPCISSIHSWEFLTILFFALLTAIMVSFDPAIIDDNIFGCQFHPEKRLQD